MQEGYDTCVCVCVCTDIEKGNSLNLDECVSKRESKALAIVQEG